MKLRHLAKAVLLGVQIWAGVLLLGVSWVAEHSCLPNHQTLIPTFLLLRIHPIFSPTSLDKLLPTAL